MNATNASVPAGIRILGIFSMLAGILCFLIGGGVLFSMLSKQFMDGGGLIVSLFLMISGIVKIFAILRIWKIKRAGITLYAISEILLLIGMATFFGDHSEQVLMINILVSLIWSVIFILIYGLFIRNRFKQGLPESPKP